MCLTLLCGVYRILCIYINVRVSTEIMLVAMTVCGFVQAEDALVSQLSHAIKKVAERVTNAPETVEFDYFSSTNFIGLFITEQFAALLKQITTDFAEEMKKTGMVKLSIFSVFWSHS